MLGTRREGHTMVFTKLTDFTLHELNGRTRKNHLLQILKGWMTKLIMELVGGQWTIKELLREECSHQSNTGHRTQTRHQSSSHSIDPIRHINRKTFD